MESTNHNFLAKSSVFQSNHYEIKSWSWNIHASVKREVEFNDCFCLVFVTKGNLAKAAYDLGSGRVAIEKPNFDYRLVGSSGECTIINFSDDFYNSIDLGKVFKKNGKDILTNITRTSAESEYLLFQLLNATNDFDKDSLVFDLLHNSLSTSSAEENATQHNRSAIETAKEYMNHSLSNQISLFDLSRYCGVSPFYLSRLFKSYTGYSPHQYLLNIRLKHGEMLLRSTDLSIGEITYSSGFTSPEYFTARFRRKYNVTPSRYRKARS